LRLGGKRQTEITKGRGQAACVWYPKYMTEVERKMLKDIPHHLGDGKRLHPPEIIRKTHPGNWEDLKM